MKWWNKFFKRNSEKKNSSETDVSVKVTEETPLSPSDSPDGKAKGISSAYPAGGKENEESPQNKNRKFFRMQQVWLSRFVFLILTAIIISPIFVVLDRFLPTPEWEVPVDRILLFVALTAGFFFLFRKIKYAILTILGIIVISLVTTNLLNIYTFSDLKLDYTIIIRDLADEEKPISESLSTTQFPKYREFWRGANITPAVKQYANTAATKNFSKFQKGEQRKYVQFFSIFKDINDKWKYVDDPENRDYIASAEESLQSFAGDCDDYAVLMAACLKSVGGTVRLVRTQNHIYPELKLDKPKDLNMVIKLITKDLFKKQIGKNHIKYHKDDKGNVWLNMDYTDKYPGGRFLDNQITAILNM
ncbi:MAG: transglutaminase family protein [Bacteroidales bacterium]|nr:transglutaminase family protein [Bacteroidales bacterium]